LITARYTEGRDIERHVRIEKYGVRLKKRKRKKEKKRKKKKEKKRLL
jgi:hypothetical protein